MTERPSKSAGAKIARVLQLDRGRIRTLLLLACVVFGAPTWTSLAVGVAVIVPGAALHLWTKGCLRIGAEVTTSGPYRFTRNPFYLATLVVDAGICVVAWNPWIAVAYFPLWFVVHAATIHREEKALAEIFGVRYETYRAAVPRLFPRLSPATDLPASSGFTWSNPQLVDGVEYARLVRTFTAPLLVFVGGRAFAIHETELVVRWPTSTDRVESAAEWALLALMVALFVADRLLVWRSRSRKARAAV